MVTPPDFLFVITLWLGIAVALVGGLIGLGLLFELFLLVCTRVLERRHTLRLVRARVRS